MVCRELTKVYEEVVRGSLGDLAEWATGGVLGEITVVLAGAQPQADIVALVAEVEALVDARRSGERCVRGSGHVESGRAFAS